MPSMRRVNLHTWKQTLVTWKLALVYSLNESGPLIFITNSCSLCRRWTFRSGLIALIYQKHLWLLTVVLALVSQTYVGHMAIFWAQQPTSYSLDLLSLFIFSSGSLSLLSPQQFITEGFAFMVACSLWLFPAGWLQISPPGEKRKRQDKSTLAILSLWNPHHSHWLEYNPHVSMIIVLEDC